MWATPYRARPGRRLCHRRPTDAPAFVSLAEPIAAFAVAIRFVEAGLDLVQLIDLGYGACRFVVAEPGSAKGAADAALCAPRFHLRVDEVIRASPRRITIELACKPISLRFMATLSLVLWLACPTAIVDITATGTTLRENDLVIVDEVLKCSARFFAKSREHSL